MPGSKRPQHGTLSERVKITMVWDSFFPRFKFSTENRSTRFGVVKTQVRNCIYCSAGSARTSRFVALTAILSINQSICCHHKTVWRADNMLQSTRETGKRRDMPSIAGIWQNIRVCVFVPWPQHSSQRAALLLIRIVRAMKLWFEGESYIFSTHLGGA